MNGGAMPLDGGRVRRGVFQCRAARDASSRPGDRRRFARPEKNRRFVAECGGRGHIGGIWRGIRRAFARREPDSAVLPPFWRFAGAPEKRGLNAGCCRDSQRAVARRRGRHGSGVSDRSRPVFRGKRRPESRFVRLFLGKACYGFRNYS
ncbi:hypothetical protein OFAG_02201 [Oxalobacter formigenes HOxBLS]|uniref:Uncharacterized protein n=1 Tax=Oxalobacter paraformigenes TaxID=556268 RepID=T5LUS4_9BURK|nr:hypothetical protein OFAG_02201 [Oxalobacter paraformigenes]